MTQFHSRIPAGLAAALVAASIASAAYGSDVQVVDGDTLKIGTVTYRLHGIDTPEPGQRCNEFGGGTWPCGDLATRHLERLIDGAAVACDDRGSDDYDRVIAVCFANTTNINAQLVLDGMAWAFRTYSNDFVPEEGTARQKGVGIWQTPTQTAEDYRRERWTVAEQEAPEGCPIKGNISRNGQIYHAPWSPWYTRTKVSVEQGEQWFCSEREALDAGWRAPYWGR